MPGILGCDRMLLMAAILAVTSDRLPCTPGTTFSMGVHELGRRSASLSSSMLAIRVLVCLHSRRDLDFRFIAIQG